MSTIHSPNVVIPAGGGSSELVTNSYPSPVKSNHESQIPTTNVFVQQTLNHHHHHNHHSNNNRTLNTCNVTSSKSSSRVRKPSDEEDNFALLTIKTSLKRNRSPSLTDERTNHETTENENIAKTQQISPHISTISDEKTIANGPTTLTPVKAVRQSRKKRQTRDIDHNLGRHLSADKLHVYRWPPSDTLADLHVLQEQICDYLSLKSFKRKYPDISRRVVDLNEREYLKSQNVVTETQCDLGLTALKLDEILNVMSTDYPDKHRQFNQVWQNKRRSFVTSNTAVTPTLSSATSTPSLSHVSSSLSATQSTILPTVTTNENENEKLNKSITNDRPSKQLLSNVRQDTIRSAVEYNQQIQRERRKDRQACFDLQTMQIHFPANKQFRLPQNLTHVGSYPLPLVPGQYHDAFIKYTSDELKYMPINTALYYYPKPLSLVQSERFDQATSDEENEDEMEIGSSMQIQQQSVPTSFAPIQSHLPPIVLQPQQLQSSLDSNGVFIETQSSCTNGPLSRTLINKQNSLNSHNSQSTQNFSSSTNSTTTNICYICKQQRSPNQQQQQQDDQFITCSTCLHRSHPQCLDINLEMLQIIQTYQWQCMDCKNCSTCNKPHDEAQMMFCDRCDRGYHTYCVGLQAIPDGSWQCSACVIYKREVITPPPLSTTSPITKNRRGRIANNSRLSSSSTRLSHNFSSSSPIPITTATSSPTTTTTTSRGRGSSRRGRVKLGVNSSTNHSFPLSPLNTSSNSSTTNDAPTPPPHAFVQPSIPFQDTSSNTFNPILNCSSTIVSSSLTLNNDSSNGSHTDSKHSWTTNNQR